MISVGDTDIYSSPIFDNDATVWPDDSMLLDDWASVSHIWLNDPGLNIDHRTDGRSTASFVVHDSTGSLTFYERQQVLIQYYDGWQANSASSRTGNNRQDRGPCDRISVNTNFALNFEEVL